MGFKKIDQNTKHFQKGSKIYNENNYGQILWLCGFVKTSLSNALFVIGVTLFFNGLTNAPAFRGWEWSAMLFGIASFILGLVVIYMIDKRRETLKKEEYGRRDEDIDKKIIDSQLQQDLDLHGIVQEAAKEMVKKAMKEEIAELREVNCADKNEKELSNFQKDVLE